MRKDIFSIILTPFSCLLPPALTRPLGSLFVTHRKRHVLHSTVLYCTVLYCKPVPSLSEVSLARVNCRRQRRLIGLAAALSPRRDPPLHSPDRRLHHHIMIFGFHFPLSGFIFTVSNREDPQTSIPAISDSPYSTNDPHGAGGELSSFEISDRRFRLLIYPIIDDSMQSKLDGGPDPKYQSFARCLRPKRVRNHWNSGTFRISGMSEIQQRRMPI
jgi:hypothetical protein